VQDPLVPPEHQELLVPLVLPDQRVRTVKMVHLDQLALLDQLDQLDLLVPLDLQDLKERLLDSQELQELTVHRVKMD